MWLLGGCLCGPFQELSRRNGERIGKATYDFDADVVRTLFKLAQIALLISASKASSSWDHLVALRRRPKLVANVSRKSMRERRPCIEIMHLDIFHKTPSHAY